MRTAVAAEEPSSGLFIVSKQGVVLDASECIVIACSDDSIQKIRSHEAEDRYAVASSSLSAVPVEDAWWSFQANEG